VGIFPGFFDLGYMRLVYTRLVLFTWFICTLFLGQLVTAPACARSRCCFPPQKNFDISKKFSQQTYI
jgi:hypothetical protein